MSYRKTRISRDIPMMCNQHFDLFNRKMVTLENDSSCKRSTSRETVSSVSKASK